LLDERQASLCENFPEGAYLSDKTRVEKVIGWATYFKRNIHRFCSHYLGLKLYPYQIIILYLMNNFPTFCMVAARATAKSYVIAIFACAKAILYPNSRIVIASGTKDQAKLIALEKIRNELMGASPALRAEVENIKEHPNAQILFRNGSAITVVPASDNARGYRATVMIYEEYRMVPKHVVDTVLSPFLIARPTPFSVDEYYSGLIDNPMEIFISSAWRQTHWMWPHMNRVALDMVNGNGAFMLAADYSVSIRHGIKPRSFMEKERKKLDPASWGTEYGNFMITESETSFFNYRIIDKNQKLVKAFYPNEFIPAPRGGGKFSIPKKDGEIRIVSCDIAMIKDRNNDNSVFTCIRCLPENTRIEGKDGITEYERGYRRQIPYIFSMQGGETSKQAVKIKRLFEDFDADFCVIDARNAGISVIDCLSNVLYDEERDKEYEPWSCMNDDSIANRVRLAGAKPNIFAFTANVKLNSEIAFLLRQTFADGKIDLLINHSEFMEDVNVRIPEYGKVTAEEQVFFEAPYLETGFLINELINLQYEKLEQTGLIRVRERGSALKDRYSSLAMGNYFASKLELDLFKKSEHDVDVNAFASLSRAPNIYGSQKAGAPWRRRR
jgi:hypothetical protein